MWCTITDDGSRSQIDCVLTELVLVRDMSAYRWACPARTVTEQADQLLGVAQLNLSMKMSRSFKIS